MLKFITIIMLCISPLWADAQHDMGNMPGMMHSGNDTAPQKNMAGMQMNDNNMPVKMPTMSSSQSLSLPMNRNGSGTSWLPDATPMYGYMLHANKWMFMFHGDIFVRYNHQDIAKTGSRGGEKWDAPDMLMAMAQRKVGRKGLLHFNAMLSADAIIAGGSGYPLLYQTGESWQNKPLVDRQHPHDLFSELSVSYAYSLSPKADISIYAGYPGEPALGPVTFMHRPSGSFMPDAPIGHHWADATHITFGVATLGFRYGKFKVEGSSFTGREPNELRYDFDKPLFDSWSGRISFNPTSHWALQVSRGYIKSPEALRPLEDIDRTTASATYIYPIATNKYLTATLLWGQNASSGQAAASAVLGEATLKWKRINPYLRYEWVQKSAEELNLSPALFYETSQYAINTATLGLGYDLISFAHIQMAAGAQLSVYQSPSGLKSLYGSNPVSTEIYLHFYPKRM